MTTTVPVSDNDIALLRSIHRTLHYLTAAHEGKQTNDRALTWTSRAWQDVTWTMLGILAPTFVERCATNPHADIKAEASVVFEEIAKKFADSAILDEELQLFGFDRMDRAIYTRAQELRALAGVSVPRST